MNEWFASWILFGWYEAHHPSLPLSLFLCRVQSQLYPWLLLLFAWAHKRTQWWSRARCTATASQPASQEIVSYGRQLNLTRCRHHHYLQIGSSLLFVLESQFCNPAVAELLHLNTFTAGQIGKAQVNHHPSTLAYAVCYISTSVASQRFKSILRWRSQFQLLFATFELVLRPNRVLMKSSIQLERHPLDIMHNHSKIIQPVKFHCNYKNNVLEKCSTSRLCIFMRCYQ